jgi:hypothetical protein
VIEKDELGPLLEKEAASSRLNIVAGAFLAVAAFLSVTCLVDIINIVGDDSIPLVACPKAYDLDAPVLMKTIKSSGAAEKDKWVKGFIRRFIQAQFPRSPLESKASLEYVAAHARGAVKRRYEGYLDRLKEFNKLLDDNYYYSYYVSNSLDTRIRASGSSGEWAVEVDGFLVRSAGTLEERTSPSLHYVIRAGEHTMANPEGLYVIDSNLLEVADYVSGRKGKK